MYKFIYSWYYILDLVRFRLNRLNPFNNKPTPEKMKLHDEVLKEIEELVKNYCEERGFTPDGCRLVVSVTLESKFQVSAMSGVPLSILKENPLVLWKRDRGHFHYYGVKIGNTLNDVNFKSMYQLVTQERSDILKRRDFGRKCLRELEDWLETFGLKLGMIFPEEIVQEFPPAPKRPSAHLSLAELIAQNLDD